MPTDAPFDAAPAYTSPVRVPVEFDRESRLARTLAEISGAVTVVLFIVAVVIVR